MWLSCLKHTQIKQIVSWALFNFPNLFVIIAKTTNVFSNLKCPLIWVSNHKCWPNNCKILSIQTDEIIVMIAQCSDYIFEGNNLVNTKLSFWMNPFLGLETSLNKCPLILGLNILEEVSQFALTNSVFCCSPFSKTISSIDVWRFSSVEFVCETENKRCKNISIMLYDWF